MFNGEAQTPERQQLKIYARPYEKGLIRRRKARVSVSCQYTGQQSKYGQTLQVPGVDSSQYWMECAAYLELGRGLDPEGCLPGRVRFIRSVQILRTELEKYLT